MLIPQDRGSTRTLSLSAFPIWVIVALLTVLSFGSAFFYGRQRAIAAEVSRLEQINQDLGRQCARPAAEKADTFNAKDRIELERRMRAEYEASLAVIASQLSDLYDLETDARNLTGIGVRDTSGQSARTGPGGKGGGEGGLGDVAYEEEELLLNPAHVTYGLSSPSADMIIQEINVRSASLRGLVAGLQQRETQLRILPSIWPLPNHKGAITSGFGLRRDPFHLRIRHHNGTDISARGGTPILATADGVVVFSGRDGNYGRVVRIDHGNGIQTDYCHLCKRLVEVGDRVARRDAIGKLGSSGRSTGPHLHYEVRVNGKAVDAAKYLPD